MPRPVAVTCPHCGASLEVELPVPNLGDHGVVRVKFPEHYLAEPSRVSVVFDLAGSLVAATLSPLCPFAGARLSAPSRAVGAAVDADLRRRT